MLAVRVLGGLGNQLFQYCFYEFLKLNNENVYLDISGYNKQKYHYGFELDKLFDLDYEEYQGKQFPHCDRSSWLYRAARKFFGITLAKSADYYVRDISVVRKDSFNEDIYFDGFYQDPYYAQQIPDLERKLTFKELELDERNTQLVGYLRSHETVSVHIRRGDYLNHPVFANCCDVNYYMRAIEHFQKQDARYSFVFFSDDIEWCKSMFSELSDTRFVDWNTGENSYLDLYLMAQCKHNIIANSSFSWWGAFLNRNTDKQVILPAKWCNNTDGNCYGCEGWLKV